MAVLRDGGAPIEIPPSRHVRLASCQGVQESGKLRPIRSLYQHIVGGVVQIRTKNLIADPSSYVAPRASHPTSHFFRTIRACVANRNANFESSL